MHIESVRIKGIRAFPHDNDVEVKLGKVFTAIAGLNGTGKSTVLAVLGNVGYLRKRVGEHLNGDPFKAELSEILKYDVGHDQPGGKVEVKFADDQFGMVENIQPSGVMSFRASIYSANNPSMVDGVKLERKMDPRSRFRLIPEPGERPQHSEAKLEWPTYYLGLSRLYPVGETFDYESKTAAWDDEVLKVYNDAYRHILNIGQDVKKVGLITSDSVARKKGAGITTSSYGMVSNSAGQDNLGQILLAALSFKALKSKLGEHEFRGGILLIDEVEATLHPVAQTRLYDFLYNTAKETGFQVICTTHSLSLLERIARDTHPKNPMVKVSYFVRTGDELEVLTNPSMDEIEADMNNRILSPNASADYPRIFLEDDVARLVFECIRKERFSDLPVTLSEGNVGWNELLTMANEFSTELAGSLIILDPDVRGQETNSIRQKLSKSIFKHPEDELLARDDRHILFLPGERPVEEMLYKYYDEQGETCEVYNRDAMKAVWASYYKIMNLEGMPHEYDGLQKYKWWFNRNSLDLKVELIRFWLLNSEVGLDEFADQFRENYKVASRLA